MLPRPAGPESAEDATRALRPAEPDGRLPIIVGITGHRDPREADRLRHDLLDQLKRIDELVPNSPIWLLSPLAAGADQEFAEIGLDKFPFVRRLQGPDSVELVVPLPFELPDYRLDFATDPAGLERFDRLLVRANRTFVLPPRRPSDLRDHRGDDGVMTRRVGGSDDPSDEIRSLHYDRLGRFMATHAHVMIAAWNGRPSGGRGGTASIIAYCERGDSAAHGEGIPLRADLSPIERRRPTPVCRVHCPRRSDPPESEISTALDGDGPHTVLSPVFRADAERIDRINTLRSPSMPRRLHDSAEHTDRGPIAWFAGSLWKRKVEAGRIPKGLEEMLHSSDDADSRLLARQFIRLDAWANLDKASYQAAAVMSAAILGGSLLLLQFHGLGVGPLTRAAVFGYLVGLAVYIRWKRILRRRETDRAIVRPAAELLRIQIAWIIGGLHRLVMDEIVPRRRKDLASIDEILKGPMLTTLGRRMSTSNAGADGDGIPNIDLVKRWWIDDQLGYCDGRGLQAKRRRSLHMDMGRRVLRVCVLGVAIMSSVIASLSFIPGLDDAISSRIDLALPLAEFCMGVSLVAVLVIQFLEAVTLDRQDVNQADGMRPLLLNAVESMESAERDRPDAARKVLLDLGRSIADEQVEWFTRHKEGADLDIVG